ncbi:unnamed protein product [Polarella glacialis]|uniref:Uncharacterized protein n=1 Tax=Polarella glacialis TaxID=89957 RepID=A0A813FH17_POLGL|nr:unnamed protein product [Polarella glacialis]
MGRGQANVPPLRWSLSIEQFIFFIGECAATDTWQALVAHKGGEGNITMYDLKDHFIVPWTAGTGSSIALLMNSGYEEGYGDPVELMISHAWGGAAVETYNCLQNIVNHNGIPTTARIFFCTLSMYQPEDGAKGGLSIAEQLTRRPFAVIIDSKPKHGMHVVHTTVFEVYSRLWTVHEIDEAVVAGVQIFGTFDFYAFDLGKLRAIHEIDASKAECRPEDRPALTQQIDERGGFHRLSRVIQEKRAVMLNAYEKFRAQFEDATDVNGHHAMGYPETKDRKRQFDWTQTEESDRPWHPCDSFAAYHYVSVDWDFSEKWSCALQNVKKEFDISSSELVRKMLPLGKRAYPFGLPSRVDLPLE